jgi:hypothetical protein
MDQVIKRYVGKTTNEGHELRVDEKLGQVTLWFLYWGEYQGSDDHHHIGIARIKREGNAYIVGWLRGTQNQPFDESKYNSEEELVFALDAAIARRSAEVGP